MPLYLATHTIEAVTAKVPLSIVILLDHLKKKSLPADLKLRLVMPTSGTVHISLWDAPDEESLLGWLNEALSMDGTHAVSEVQEEFSWGMTFELARLRAAEKVAAGGRTTLERVSAAAKRGGDVIQQQLEALDQRTHILTAAENAVTRVRSAVTTPTAAGAAAVGAAASADAVDGEGLPPTSTPPSSTPPATGANTTTPAAVAASVSAGLSKAGQTVATWFKGALAHPHLSVPGASTGSASSTAATAGGSEASAAPLAGGSEVEGGAPSAEDLLGVKAFDANPAPPAYDTLTAANTTAPATTAPAPAEVEGDKGEGAAAAPSPAKAFATFTLDDDAESPLPSSTPAK